MSLDIPRNVIESSADGSDAPIRDDAALEAEWLANNVPSERLELHWRYASSSIQLYERHLRSLPLYGVGPALCSYLRTRLEWFSDNKLRSQSSGLLIVSVETNGEVDVKLADIPEPFVPSLDDLEWDGDALSGIARKGALFVRVDDTVVCFCENPIRDACESFAYDLVDTLGHSFGYELKQEQSISRNALESSELFFVSDEDGLVAFPGYSGELTDKMTACFEKLWSTSSRA